MAISGDRENFYAKLTDQDIENFWTINANRDLQNMKLPPEHKHRLMGGQKMFFALAISLIACGVICSTCSLWPLAFSSQTASIAAGVSALVIPLPIASVVLIILKKHYDRCMKKAIPHEKIKNFLEEELEVLEGSNGKKIPLAIQKIQQILNNYSSHLKNSVFDDRRYVDLTTPRMLSPYFNLTPDVDKQIER